MHITPFLDLLTVFRRHCDDFAEVRVLNHSLAGYHCEYQPKLCSRDPRLKRILPQEVLHRHIPGEPQWHAVKRFHAELFKAAIAEFRATFAQEFAEQKVRLFICGHPLYWCRLFEPFLANEDDGGVAGIEMLSFVQVFPNESYVSVREGRTEVREDDRGWLVGAAHDFFHSQWMSKVAAQGQRRRAVRSMVPLAPSLLGIVE